MGIGLMDGAFKKNIGDCGKGLNDSYQSGRERREKLISSQNLAEKIQFEPKYKNEIEKFFSYSIDKRIVLLHSVIGAGKEESEFITRYIKAQKKLGNLIYIPKIFNFQEDTTGGIVVCNTMRYAIKNSREAAIEYNPDSEGIKVDYGMVIFTERCTKLLNPDLDINDPIYRWIKGERNLEGDIELLKKVIDKTWHHIASNEKTPIKLEYASRPDKDGKPQPPALAPFSAIEFGMIYASEYPFKIVNLNEVMAQKELEDKLGYPKSYSKVALKLHEIYNG